MSWQIYGQIRSIFTSGLEFTRPGQPPDDEIKVSLQLILEEAGKPPRQAGEITLRQSLLGQNLKIGDRFDLKFDRPYRPNQE
jgi:hypothetical protein